MHGHHAADLAEHGHFRGPADVAAGDPGTRGWLVAAYLVFGARMCWLVIDVMRDDARGTRALIAALLFLGLWVVLGLFWLQVLRPKAQEVATTENPDR